MGISISSKSEDVVLLWCSPTGFFSVPQQAEIPVHDKGPASSPPSLSLYNTQGGRDVQGRSQLAQPQAVRSSPAPVAQQ